MTRIHDIDPGVARLDEGVTVLEASAGTGKTHRVTTEAIRELAAGTPVSALLLVTFTKAATSELRTRTWTRLHQVRDELVAVQSGDDVDDPDELTVELQAGTLADVQARAQRLDRAAAAFDRATILTIHGFCQLILRTLGLAADVEPTPTFIDDDRDLRDEVVADLRVRLGHDLPARPGAAVAATIADKALVNAQAPIRPDSPVPGSEDEARVALALGTRAEVLRRTRPSRSS